MSDEWRTLPSILQRAVRKKKGSSTAVECRSGDYRLLGQLPAWVRVSSARTPVRLTFWAESDAADHDERK